MSTTAVVRPLPGLGLVARSGELLLVCADGAPGVEELLGLVAEVAASGGDGSTLVRRAAALLAADFTGRYPACALCGPTGDERLAVLVHGSALATVAGADGEVRLSAADAITSVNRLIPGPISAVRLELPGAGAASPFARLEAGVITAAGVVAGELGPSAPAAAPLQAPPSHEALMQAALNYDPPMPAGRSYEAPVQAAPPVMESPAVDEAPVLQAEEPSPSEAWSASSMMDRAASTDWPPVAPEPPVPFPLTMRPPSEFLAPPGYEADADASYEAAIHDGPFDPAAFQPESPVGMSIGFDAPISPAYAAPPPDTPFLREPIGGSPFVSVTVGASEAPPAPAMPERDGRPLVLGLMCPNGHLTDPSAEACLTCGVSMIGRPPDLREGPRPPMGALLLDDGSTYVLDVDYILGREPHTDPEVIAGTVRPLKIADAEGVVSRKHVRVALVGWDVQIIDLGSANGTFVQHPGEINSHQLSPHHPMVIRLGTQVTMGRRWFRVEALAQE